VKAVIASWIFVLVTIMFFLFDKTIMFFLFILSFRLIDLSQSSFALGFGCFSFPLVASLSREIGTSLIIFLSSLAR